MTTSENGDDGALTEVLRMALQDARVKPVDAAAASLAVAYARAIERGGDIGKLGVGYLRVLDALQMTPKARAVAQKGGPGDAPAAPSRLDELRARRARKRDTATVDPTAP